MQNRAKKIIGGVVGAVVLVGVGSAVAGGGSDRPSAAKHSATAKQPVKASKPTEAASHPAKTKPTYTVAQQQAIGSAKNYLSDGQGFSKKGLIDQLSSSYGDGFPKKVAVFAVRHSGADWNKQAVESAKNYLSDGQGFSRQGLIEQLESSYGDQFTHQQAVYAANHVGL